MPSASSRSIPGWRRLRDFISGWYVSYLAAESARTQPEAGPAPASEQDRRQPGERHPVSGRAASRPARGDIRRAAQARAAHRERQRRDDGRRPAPAADQGRSLRQPDARTLRLRRNAEAARVSGADARPGAAAVHRLGGAGELLAPAAAPGTRRGVPSRRRAHTASRHDALAFLPEQAAPRRGAGPVAQATGAATRRRDASPTCPASTSSWRKARTSAICGWRDTSAWETRSLRRVSRSARWTGHAVPRVRQALVARRVCGLSQGEADRPPTGPLPRSRCHQGWNLGRRSSGP